MFAICFVYDLNCICLSFPLMLRTCCGPIVAVSQFTYLLYRVDCYCRFYILSFIASATCLRTVKAPA